MIKNIHESLEGDKLTVTVECSVREYASHPIKTLTTEQILVTLEQKYTVVKTLEAPKYSVGNSKRRGISQVGVWKFQIKKEEMLLCPQWI